MFDVSSCCAGIPWVAGVAMGSGDGQTGKNVRPLWRTCCHLESLCQLNALGLFQLKLDESPNVGPLYCQWEQLGPWQCAASNCLPTTFSACSVDWYFPSAANTV